MALKDLQVEEPTNKVDISEKGKLNGETIRMDKRLFIQLLTFTGVQDTDSLIAAMEAAGIDGVLYADLNDPYGVGVLTYSTEPDYFVTEVRSLLNMEPFTQLTRRDQK